MMNYEEGDDALGPHTGDYQWRADGGGIVGWDLSSDNSRDDAAMKREEIVGEITARRRQIHTILETIADHQAATQRLMTERSVVEAELRQLEETARMLRLRVPKPPANDD